MEIKDLRKEIDIIDDKIIELYVKRLEKIKDIGEIKTELNLPIEDGMREREILNRILPMLTESAQPYAMRVLNTIFDTAKAYQISNGDLRSPLKDKVLEAIKGESVVFPKVGKVACQGTEGAFSSIAARKLFEVAHITYFNSFAGVFDAVEKGLCDYGVLPIENSTVGSVNQVYDLMKEKKFHIARAIKLKVTQNLMMKKGVKFDEIKEIYSHEQAIAQSGEFLSNLKGVKIIACENTAVAARLVAMSDRRDIAAISSIECADLYGLQVYKENIQNSNNNYTRFIVITKELKIYSQSNRISVMAELSHQPGSLNNILTKFSMLGLNLTKIESRPKANAEFEFKFYFDFEGDIHDLRVVNLLAELDNGTSDFVFLGCYYEEGRR